MLVQATLRRRPKVSEDIAKLNAEVRDRISRIENFWDSDQRPIDTLIDRGIGESAELDLGKHLVTGLSCQVVYAPRLEGYLRLDKAQFDDFLTIRLNTEQADYHQFIHSVFPKLIESFLLYRGEVCSDRDVSLRDWDFVRAQCERSGKDLDGRDSVYRIWPVNFFDSLLCERAFGISSEEFVNRVSGESELAVLQNGGVLVIVTSDLVVGDALNQLQEHFMTHLLPQRDGGRIREFGSE